MVDIGVDHAPANLSRRWIALAIVLFLGLLSFAAVRSIRIECGNVYLASQGGRLLATQAGELLTTGGRSCRLAF
jgi:hypothetical protein